MRGPATINWKGLPRHRRRARAGKVDHRRCNLLGHRQAANWGVAHHILGELRISGKQRLGQRRDYEVRAYCVDTDIARSHSRANTRPILIKAALLEQ